MSFNAQGEWIDDGVGWTQVTEWCPECTPDGPSGPYTTRLCGDHMPSRDGSLDSLVSQDVYLMGTAEAGGEENQRMCRLIHRG